MFRLWGKEFKDNHMLRDMDLGNPIWLDSTVKDFQKHDKARFYQDNFIEQIDFDYLEIQVIEEDGQ